MGAVSSVTAFTSALVHPSVSAPARAAHATFITHKLAVSFTALAFAPFFLAYHGAPTLSEALVFTLGLVPLAAAMIVACTGGLVAGHAMLVTGLLGLGLTLGLGTAAGPGAALVWFVLAQWEAGRADDKRLIWICAALSVAALALVAALTASSAAALIGGLALAYAITAASAASTPPETIHKLETRSSDRMLALADLMGDLVIGFDAGGSVMDVNGSSDRLFGLPARDLYGRGLFQIVHVADRPAFLKLIADARGNETKTATIRLRAQADPEATGAFAQRFLWVEMRIRRLQDGETTAVLRDVTDAHQRTIDLERARDSIETSVRSKDDFLANMSHELRTPLNAIIGFSDMLASRTLCPVAPEKQREYALIINQSGQHLLSVVNSILDMSKIQSGTFAIVPEAFDLLPMIDQCCDIVRLKAQEGQITLVHDCPETVEQIIGDKRACKQILINLLSNAVKFTPEKGEVKVSVKPDGTAMLIIVSDTGIGIGSDDLARLGDPFFQARSSLSRPFEGTGLGLSVVRGLIGLHGGTMTIESEPSRGTSVTVRLPIDCQAVTPKTTTATIETIPRRHPIVTARRTLEPRMKSIA